MEKLKKNIWSIALLSLAVVTILPSPFADESSYMGYESVCAFAPISTLILVIASVGLYLLKNKQK